MTGSERLPVRGFDLDTVVFVEVDEHDYVSV
jgi:hypothetical protein